MQCLAWQRTSARIRRALLAGLCPVFVAACAGKPPIGLETPPPGAPIPRAAQAEPATTTGRMVRWGGEILSIMNRASSTEIAVFSRPLYDNAEPKPEGGDGVRFLAVIDGFLDPAEYRPGKRLTVAGRLAGNRELAVGDYRYPHPVIDVEHFQLWPPFVPPPAQWYWNDPFYDPRWPWRPWGAYRRRPYYYW